MLCASWQHELNLQFEEATVLFLQGVNLALKHWLFCAELPKSFIQKGGICTNIKIGRIT